MKKSTLTLLGISLCAIGTANAQQRDAAEQPAAQEPAVQKAPQTPPPSAEEVRKVVSYFLGFQTGQQFSQLGPIRLSDLDKDIFYNAIADGIKGQPADEYVEKDLRGVMEAFNKVMVERNAELVKKKSGAFQENGRGKWQEGGCNDTFVWCAVP